MSWDTKFVASYTESETLRQLLTEVMPDINWLPYMSGGRSSGTTDMENALSIRERLTALHIRNVTMLRGPGKGAEVVVYAEDIK